MDVHVRKLAARQADLVAAWQLASAGFSPAMVEFRLSKWGWRLVHPGVYALTSSPLTQHQRWVAATLTTPTSVLSHASAAACWGIRRTRTRLETITRPGDGGPRQMAGLLVLRSKTLDGNTTLHEGIPITTAARTLIDLAPHLNSKQVGRALREALRLKATSTQLLFNALATHAGRRGTRKLKELATRYAALPLNRTRSDAEGLALELLQEAGVEQPRVNIEIAGEEADLVWPEHKLIIEIDGPQYHQFPAEDERKQRRWENAGYAVRRIPSDAVYDDPARLIALAPRLPWTP
jgi:very-short-patch-repair endonuclease